MLLSRVADNLYWMSRYLERAEHTARLVDVSLNLTLEQSPEASERRWQRLLDSLSIEPGDAPLDAYQVTERVTFDASRPNSIVNCITAARENAQHVREMISSEMWEQVNRLYLHVKRTRLDQIWNDPHEFYQNVKDGSHLFQGITDSTMIQGEGWYFIQVGRLIERAGVVAGLVGRHYRDFTTIQPQSDSATDYLEWVGLLKSCTAFEAYCKVYTADLRSDRVAEFLLLNPEFPHSLCFAAMQIQNALRAIADATDSPRAGRVNKLAGRLRATLEFAQIDELTSGDLQQFLTDVQRLCAQIHTAIYNTYITYPVERELSA